MRKVVSPITGTKIDFLKNGVGATGWLFGK